MYTIKMTRCTGEQKTFSVAAKEHECESIIRQFKRVDVANREPNAYKYEIIEIGNSAETTK